VAEPTLPPLLRPITALRNVGSERAAHLARLGIHTIGDLLLHRPARYENRRQFQKIADLQQREPGLTCGRVIASGLKTFKQRTRSVFELIMDDGSARLHCRWWNLPFMERYFKVGDTVVVYGKVISLRPRTIDHPETEIIDSVDSSIHLNRIAAIYPLTEGIQQRWLRAILWNALEQYESAITELHPQISIPDLPSRGNAIRMLHFPEEDADVEIARSRLALDEYIDLQLAIQTRRRNLEAHAPASPCAGDNRLIRPFLAKLGFTLTDAQTTVLREIRKDMGGPHPMRRLLQGDVGSGKTVVAACAVLMALESGRNCALMAPTEILAEQHWHNFRRWLEPLGVAVELRTGSLKTAHATSNLQPTLHIGTHALVESGFTPEKLGLVIIDEQHKFGVAQRETLLRKGAYPHLLVMTATPIPRTLGLTLYGDLDISIIDHSPSGRGQIKTYVRKPDSLPKVWEFIRSKLKEGRQAYIVYSRVEDTGEGVPLKAVRTEFERLRQAFTPYQVGLLHGQLKSAEKENVMAAFRANEIQILLATTVVEVGLDVPNATIMLIENAEQFGLSQLHQLRGRIGRGAEDSYCILVGEAKTSEAKARLKIMQETRDGFRIAEEDLRLRGPGEFLGKQQSGDAPLIFGDLAKDIHLVERARSLAKDLLKLGGAC
jgi:ATP-dependent DNA helicase RecG